MLCKLCMQTQIVIKTIKGVNPWDRIFVRNPACREHLVYILWAESPGQRAQCREHMFLPMGREPRAESTLTFLFVCLTYSFSYGPICPEPICSHLLMGLYAPSLYAHILYRAYMPRAYMPRAYMLTFRIGPICSEPICSHLICGLYIFATGLSALPIHFYICEEYVQNSVF
jgi:hypothetical protein